MIRRTLGLSALGLAGILTSAQADIGVTGIKPTITIDPNANIPSNHRTNIEIKMNEAMGGAFDKTLADANTDLAKYKSQKKLANGFANANAYSMNSGTLMGYQNYDLFAVSFGGMVGVQAPSTDLGYYSKIPDEIQEKGDLYAGVGAGITFLNVGLNAKFLLPGLYLNARYGGFEPDINDKVSIKTTNFGLGANYRLLDSKSLVGIITWRGISVGSGFYYQNNEVEITIEGDSIGNPIPFRATVVGSGANSTDSIALGAAMTELGFDPAHPDAVLSLFPDFKMNLDVSTITVPLEASTAVSLLWGALNVSAGVGTDLNFGSSKIVLKGLAKAKTMPESGDISEVTFSDAEVTIAGGTEGSPSLVRTRAMMGFGIGLGPVKVDVPVYYYLASGVGFGVTVGVVW